MNIHNTWLQAIKGDIQNKYHVDQPVLTVDDEILEKQKIDDWLKKVVLPPYWWLKYKKTGPETFELKPFSPFPDDAIVMKLINDFLNSLNFHDFTPFFYR